MHEKIKRSMIIKSSRIRFLEAWARRLPSRDVEEVRHAVEVFAQNRFGVSRQTARNYAREVMQFLNQEIPNDGEEVGLKKIVTFRMEISEYRKLEASAKNEGIKISEFIRRSIQEAMRQKKT